MQIVIHPQQYKQLRQLALHSQGLYADSPFGKGLEGAQKVISHLGYIQLDSISVIERAHHHVLYSRVKNYEVNMTDQLLKKGDVFEYWSHAAAFLPMHDFRFSLPYKHAIKSGQIHWYKDKDEKLMSVLLQRIRDEGPLRSRDIESVSSKQTSWWDWKPAKKALEQLYIEGDLMVRSREGFQKTYDLRERVLPSTIDTCMPSIEEFARHIIHQQLRCHGLVSLKGFTYLRKNTDLRKAVKIVLSEAEEEGWLEQIKLDSNGQIFYIPTGSLEEKLPTLSPHLHILSPFDNIVIQRDRLKSLFNFEYQIECYVPAAKRKYGYFALPLLYKDTFIGQMDCKVHRNDAHLEIKGLFLDNNVFEKDSLNEVDISEHALLNAFVEAIKEFCVFQNCSRISLNNMYPRALKNYYRKALNQL